ARRPRPSFRAQQLGKTRAARGRRGAGKARQQGAPVGRIAGAAAGPAGGHPEARATTGTVRMIPRYSRPEMAALWTPERRYQTWLEVELAAGRAMAQAGLVPREAIDECAARGGTFTAADAARIDEIEKTTRHDVIAFLTFMEERIGPAARHLHFGMTSSDVLDTSLAMLLRDAADLLVAGVEKAREAVVKRAIEH